MKPLDQIIMAIERFFENSYMSYAYQKYENRPKDKSDYVLNQSRYYDNRK